MTTITIVKTPEGKFEGLGEKDRLAYHKLCKRQKEMEPGEMLSMSVWFDRSLPMHQFHFVMLTAFFDSQEQFHDPDQFRYWVEVGAGHCEFVPGPAGRMVAIAKSIAWHRLDEAEFEIHHRKVIDFIRSDHFQRFLWPHLAPAQTHETVETILGQLERA